MAEFKKKNCNNIILKKLLKITYDKRHIEISSCQTRLTEILDKILIFCQYILCKITSMSCKYKDITFISVGVS